MRPCCHRLRMNGKTAYTRASHHWWCIGLRRIVQFAFPVTRSSVTADACDECVSHFAVHYLIERLTSSDCRKYWPFGLIEIKAPGVGYNSSLGLCMLKWQNASFPPVPLQFCAIKDACRLCAPTQSPMKVTKRKRKGSLRFLALCAR